MQLPSAARKPELPPSKQAAAATNTITEKAKAAVQEIVVQHKTLWVGIGVGILLVR